MAHSQQTKDNVRKLYIEGMPLTAAAVASGVSYDTARDWKAKSEIAGNDWDIERAAQQLSTQNTDELIRSLIHSMVKQSLITARELENSSLPAQAKVELQASLADAMAKFSKSLGRVAPKMGALSVAFDTLKLTAEYLSKHDKAALATFQEHLEGIGASLQSRYGG